jgi:DnaJ-class molecular chaperone
VQSSIMQDFNPDSHQDYDRNGHRLQRLNYYSLLGLHPSATPIEIRRAYRSLSKEYHPDSTELPAAEAHHKFQELNQAYATLSNPTRRLLHDQSIGYSRVRVMQAPPTRANGQWESKSAYLDPIDRPLSPGEIFMLLLLVGCFLACIGLVLVVATSRGELVMTGKI